MCNVRQAIKMNPNYVPALLEYARFQLAKKVLHVADVCVCIDVDIDTDTNTPSWWSIRT